MPHGGGGAQPPSFTHTHAHTPSFTPSARPLVHSYVLDEEAGSSPLEFQHGLRRDCDAAGVRLRERELLREGAPGGRRGMQLADFMNDERVRATRITESHVAALRLYTTAAFQYINNPLREGSLTARETRAPHPLPLLVKLLEEATKQLGGWDEP